MSLHRIDQKSVKHKDLLYKKTQFEIYFIQYEYTLVKAYGSRTTRNAIVVVDNEGLIKGIEEINAEEYKLLVNDSVQGIDGQKSFNNKFIEKVKEGRAYKKIIKQFLLNII